MDAVDVVVHGGTLVLQAVRAGKRAVIAGKDDKGVLGQAQMVELGQHAAQLLVDERAVAPLGGDQAPPRRLVEAVEGPVRGVVALYHGLAGERLGHARR